MARYAIIKLCHLSPLHIGTGRESYDTSSAWLHSDTLASALASLKAQRGDSDVAEFMSQLVVSSAFPFYKDLQFLPKAHGRVRFANEEKCRKSLKRVTFIEQSLWTRLAAGGQLSESDVTIDGDFMYPAGRRCATMSRTQTTQRVRVYADTEKDAEPFFFEWRYFDHEAGLYFLTTATGLLLDELVTLATMLGETGLGTDRNVGGGHFEVEVSEVEINNTPNADAQVLLSLFIPDRQDMPNLNLEDARYGLLRRGGFAAGSSIESLRHLRKRSVYMFDEGSVFPTQTPLGGTVVDLRPDWNAPAIHPMLRSGKPFFLPYKM